MMSLLFFMVRKAHLRKTELVLYYCMINFFFLYLDFIFLKLGRPSFLSLYSGDDPNLLSRGRYVLDYSSYRGFIRNRLGRRP